MEEKPKSNKGRVVLIVVVLIVFIIIIAKACGGSSKESDNKSSSDQTSQTTETTQGKAAEEVSGNWVYSEKQNEMDDSKTYFAQTEALEKMEFDFPYNGGTEAWITVRKGSAGLDVMLSISKGQFLSNLMGNKSIKVRFDDGKAETYSYNDPADHSTTMIFIKNPAKFLKGLQSAKQTIIQCEFYQEGVQTMKFNTEGLKWDH